MAYINESTHKVNKINRTQFNNFSELTVWAIEMAVSFHVTGIFQNEEGDDVYTEQEICYTCLHADDYSVLMSIVDTLTKCGFTKQHFKIKII